MKKRYVAERLRRLRMAFRNLSWQTFANLPKRFKDFLRLPGSSRCGHANTNFIRCRQSAVWRFARLRTRLRRSKIGPTTLMREFVFYEFPLFLKCDFTAFVMCCTLWTVLC